MIITNKRFNIKDLAKEINLYTGADYTEVMDILTSFKSKLKNQDLVTLIRNQAAYSDKEEIMKFLSLDPKLLLSFTEINEYATYDLKERSYLSYYEAKNALQTLMEKLYNSSRIVSSGGKISYRKFYHLKKSFFDNESNLENIVYNLSMLMQHFGYHPTINQIRDDFSFQEIEDLLYLNTAYISYWD